MLLAAGVGAYWYFLRPSQVKCPDGTYIPCKGLNCEERIACGELPDLTVSWQTYRNEEYGFEVKYPKDYFTRNALTTQGKLITIYFVKKGANNLDFEVFSIEFTHKNVNDSIKEFAIRNFRNEINKTVFVNMTEIDNRESYRLEGKVSPSIIGLEDGIVMHIDGYNYFYTVDYIAYPDYVDIITQILSTFKFTP